MKSHGRSGVLCVLLLVAAGCSGRPSDGKIQQLILDGARGRNDRATLSYKLDRIGNGFQFSKFMFSGEGIRGLDPAGYGSIIGYSWGGDPDPVVQLTPAIQPFVMPEGRIKIAEVESVIVKDTRKNPSGSITVEATLKYKPTQIGAILTSHGGAMANLMTQDVTVVLEKWERGWKVDF